MATKVIIFIELSTRLESAKPNAGGTGASATFCLFVKVLRNLGLVTGK